MKPYGVVYVIACLMQIVGGVMGFTMAVVTWKPVPVSPLLAAVLFLFCAINGIRDLQKRKEKLSLA